MTTEQRLTDWIDGSVKPVLPGVYQCRGMFAIPVDTYQHWDGKAWGGWSGTTNGAYADRDMRSVRQSPDWRGLASDPKAVQP